MSTATSPVRARARRPSAPLGRSRLATVVVIFSIAVLAVAVGSGPAQAHHPRTAARGCPVSRERAPFIPGHRPAAAWTGTFQSGRLDPWQTLPGRDSLPGRIVIVSKVPCDEARYAAEFIIASNDPSPYPKDPNHQRAEVRATQTDSEGFPGADVWYGWSVYFPKPGFTDPAHNPNRTTPGTYFTQWMRTAGECGSPNVVFEVDKARHEGIYVQLHGGVNAADDGDSTTCPGTVYRKIRLASFIPNRWYDFVFHVIWSSDPAVGFAEVWMNGKRVLRGLHFPTLYRDWNRTADYGVYLRQGIKRNMSPDNGSYLFEEGMRIGDSYAAVAPTP